MVSQETGSPMTGELLNTFVTHNRSHFPLLVRVTDWKEETSILENHVVRPGVELVVHGWTRQTKVLAKAGRLFYAVPLTYGGQFRVRAKTFNGAVQLWNSRPKSCLRVVRPDADDPNLLNVGDLLRLKRPQDDDDDGDDYYADGGGGDRRRSVRETNKFLRCEKLHPGSGSSTDFRIALTCSARFEEVLDDFPANPDSVQIRNLVATLTHRDVEVELITPSPDRPAKDRDLPDRTPILLSDNVTEQAVYVSVESPTAPAFHLPLRTLIYVTIVRALDKRCSPLLTKQAPKLSTLDRCVELLPPEVFDSLRPSQRSFESPDFVAEESRPMTKVHGPGTSAAAQFDASSEDSRTSGYPGSLSISIKASNGPQRLSSSRPTPSPKSGSNHHPMTYIEHPPQDQHGQSHSPLSPLSTLSPLSPSSFCDSGRMHSVPFELPSAAVPLPGQHHPTSLQQNQSTMLGDGRQNYHSQPLPPQTQLIHPQTQTAQPQAQIIHTQAQNLQSQAQMIQSQLQYTQHQVGVQGMQPLTIAHQPQFQSIDPQTQVFQQSHIQPLQSHVDFNQSQLLADQPQVHFTQNFAQPLQAQLHLPQFQMQGTQPQLTQSQVQSPQPQLQMSQPQFQMAQPQFQMAQSPQFQMAQPQLHMSQPQLQFTQSHMQLGQPSMLGFQPQSQLATQQVVMTQPHLQLTQPQMQLTEPQMQLAQAQWTQMQLAQPQMQLAQPQMQLAQPQRQLQFSQPQAQMTQPHHSVQLETQQTSVSTLQTGPTQPPVFKKKGKAPSIPQTPTTQVLVDADHLQRAQQQQQQQPEHPMEVPPGFGLVPLQSTNGFAIPPGFVLVPLQSSAPPSIAHPPSSQQPTPANQKQVKFSHPGDDDDDSDDDVKPEAEVVAKKVAGFKLKIPDDGNLYELSSKRFAEFLAYLRIEPDTLRSTKKTSLDGKKFAGLSEDDLVVRNLVNPVLVHFRRLTEKPQKKSFVL